MTNHNKFKLKEKCRQNAWAYAEVSKFFNYSVSFYWLLSKIGQLPFEQVKCITSKIFKYSVLGSDSSTGYVNFVKKKL